MIETLAVQGYRSLRDVVVGLGRLTVITGPNGAGKSNLYKAIRLLADAGHGQLIGSLARSGGLDSVRWAGPEQFSAGMRAGDLPVQGTRRTGPVRLRLGFAGDGFGYAIDLGLPTPAEAGRFPLDPRVKAEAIWSGPLLRPATTLIDRAGGLVRTREARSWVELSSSLSGSESILSELAGASPEIGAVRDRLRGWRCYDPPPPLPPIGNMQPPGILPNPPPGRGPDARTSSTWDGSSG
ncbi:MAG TPA: AAA family ATPase, partial [Microlunatus sp.]|nr:AAA family ATPase [Microlunatus sp.]